MQQQQGFCYTFLESYFHWEQNQTRKNIYHITHLNQPGTYSIVEG